jgi:hypothetical protein
MRIAEVAAALAVVGCLVPGTAGALDPAIKCHAAKLKLAGKYASCRLIADATAVKNATPPDYSTCDERLQTGWQKVENNIGGECPEIGDLEDVQDSIVECSLASRYLVRIGVVSTHTFSGVQLDVDYSQAAGAFEGAGSDVSCTVSIPGSLVVFDDDETTRALTVAVVNQDGFESPIELATCIFEGLGIADPVPADFGFVNVQGADPNGDPIAGIQPGVVIEKLP